MEQNHGAYEDSQIQVLEGLEAVRKRPGMYIGTTSEKGLHHLVYEIVDNSIDEALAGMCDKITVEIHTDGSVSVEDDGRGIPSGIHPVKGIPTLEVVYTMLHAGGKFGGGGYKIAGGLHGVGASVVNALSEWLEIDNYHGTKHCTERFERGKVARPFYEDENTTGRHGVYVRFKPDPAIFTDTTEFKYDILLNRMREQAFLNAGVRIVLRDLRTDPVTEDDLCYEGGIISYVEYLNAGRTALTPDVIYMKGQKGDSIAEVAMQYNDGYNATVVSFANNMATIDGGTHEEGFRAALLRSVNKYARAKGFLKDSDPNLTQSDVLEGLCAIISVKLTDAQFESQTKAKLGNSDVRTLVSGIVSDKLDEYFEEHPAETKVILEKTHLRGGRPRGGAQGAREHAAQGRARLHDPARQAGRLPGEKRFAHRAVPGRGRLGRRLCQGRTRQPLSGDPAAARQGAQRREEPRGQGLRQPVAHPHYSGAGLRYRRQLQHGEAALRQDYHHGGCRCGRLAHSDSAAHLLLPAHEAAD